jgi:hypothetical protein
MISERLLRRWRKEALIVKSAAIIDDDKKSANDVILTRSATVDKCNKILKLTQVLLDQHLINKK